LKASGNDRRIAIEAHPDVRRFIAVEFHPVAVGKGERVGLRHHPHLRHSDLEIVRPERRERGAVPVEVCAVPDCFELAQFAGVRRVFLRSWRTQCEQRGHHAERDDGHDVRSG